MKKILLLAVVAMLSLAQTRSLSESEAMAPRSALLRGTAAYGSPTGQYVITFADPNNCPIPHVKASSRAMALYAVTSKGGFTLKASDGSLSVWTLEEWGPDGATWEKDHHCN